MKKLIGTIIFCGIVLIVGPFFGFTIRGASDLDYGSSFLFGIILIAIGLFLYYLSEGIRKAQNVNHGKNINYTITDDICPHCDANFDEDGDDNDDEKTFTCGDCGAIVSDDDDVCPHCGASFDEDDNDNDDDDDDEKTFTCGDCGAIVSDDDDICPHCGASFDEDDNDNDDDDDEKTFTCSDCGAIVSDDDDVCPHCGASFDEDNNDVDDTEKYKEEIIIPLLIEEVMQENIEYFLNSYYDLNIHYGEMEITDTENVFEDVSPQLLCLKLVHNISMMSAFAINYIENNNALINNSASKQKKLFLKLSIRTEDIDIIQRKGFGLLIYNVDDMAFALHNFYPAIKYKLEHLAKKNKYKFLERVLKEFNGMYLYTNNPNDALIHFLNNNKDLYKKQITKIKKLLNDENN